MLAIKEQSNLVWLCIKHLLDETESNIRFVLSGQVMLGEAELSLTSLYPGGKTKLMLDLVEFSKCFIITKIL